MAVTVLGVGIAVNLAVFAVTSATLFKGFRGIPDQDRLSTSPAGADAASYLDLTDWQAATTRFVGLEAVADLRVSIDTGCVAPAIQATRVDPLQAMRGD